MERLGSSILVLAQSKGIPRKAGATQFDLKGIPVQITSAVIYGKSNADQGLLDATRKTLPGFEIISKLLEREASFGMELQVVHGCRQLVL